MVSTSGSVLLVSSCSPLPVGDGRPLAPVDHERMVISFPLHVVVPLFGPLPSLDMFSFLVSAKQ